MVAGADDPWQDWLRGRFPQVCNKPFALRHARLWDWFDALEPGTKPRARVEVWGRGGAKSSTGELGVVRVGARLRRRFCLYVSGTQDQADKHVQSIASLFERLGVGRAVNRYGHSRGWRRNQLRTDNGFNVAALGLDVAVRGVKLDEFRPDLIILDDIDSQEDSLKTIDKKIKAICSAIIPAGSPDVAILFLQNKIHEEGIVSRLCDGRADFLHNRELAYVEPAVVGLQVESRDRGDGLNEYRIVAGEATWEGQDLETCEAQINEWGYRTFLREAQHEVEGADGYVFLVSQMKVWQGELPEMVAFALAGDLAATEDGGNWTVLFPMGRDEVGRLFVFPIVRGQWAADRVQAAIRKTAEHYRNRFPRMRLRLPQDGGQAGKSQAIQMRREHGENSPRIEPVTGSKITRASGFAEEVNKGNVYLVDAPLPDWVMLAGSDVGGKPLMMDVSTSRWHSNLRDELRKIREDEPDQQDDQMDAGADAFNEIAMRRQAKVAIG